MPETGISQDDMRFPRHIIEEISHTQTCFRTNFLVSIRVIEIEVWKVVTRKETTSVTA